jgi:3-oxoacyl-[acyl-carrier protein] reductase
MIRPQATLEKVAIVFGGSRGIGAAIARRMSEDGFAVALTFVRRADKADEVVASIRKRCGDAIAIEADSADPAAIRSAVDEAVRAFGPLDAAIINAGILRLGAIDSIGLDDLDHSLDINVRGVFLAIQAAAARMRDGGRIIVIGSNAALKLGHPGSSVYAMTKAAVARLVEVIALDLAPRRITVNTIQPGPIETDLTASMVEQMIALSPLKRIGKPEDIAALASYVAGPASAYMTGATLTIDGGFSL